MTPPAKERGAALLTVLMLVAVIATISAAALDRLTVAARLSGNAAILVQSRQWVTFAEQLAAVRLEDLAAADAARTLAGPWLGTPRTIALPDGGTVAAEVRDGGNCFNLNSLVRGPAGGPFTTDWATVRQFSGLLQLLGTDSGRADAIAEATADWVDSDSSGTAEGPGEDPRWSPANALMADPGELHAVRGVTPELMGLAAPFLCALPEAAPSAINPNTLLPEQAVLVAMLAPGQLSVAQGRAAIAGRPATGYDSSIAFWASPAFAGVAVPPQASEQIRLKSRWFELRTRVRNGEQELAAVSLVDLTSPRARIVRRRYGDPA